MEIGKVFIFFVLFYPIKTINKNMDFMMLKKVRLSHNMEVHERGERGFPKKRVNNSRRFHMHIIQFVDL